MMVSLLPFVSFFVCFTIGLFVYFQSSRKPIHMIFLALCITNAYLALVEFLHLQAADIETSYIWAKSGFLRPFVASIAMQFIISFYSKIKIFKSRWFLAAIYAPPCVFSFSWLFTSRIMTGMFDTKWGYAVKYTNESLLADVYFLWLLAMGLSMTMLAIIYYVGIAAGKKKKQAKYIAFGFISPTLLVNFSNLLTVLFDIHFPGLLSMGTALQEIFLGYAIWKYGLFDLNLKMAAKNIVATMSDLLILINTDRTVVFVNEAVPKTTGYREQELLGSDIVDLLSGNVTRLLFDEAAVGDPAESMYQRAIGNDVQIIDGVLTNKDGRNVPVSATISVLTKERGKTVAGYVLAVRDVTEIRKVREEREKLIQELQAALENIKTLSGLIPICANCKKIRDDQGYWNQIEYFIEKHSDAFFSHGICPDCAETLYGKKDWYQKQKKKRNTQKKPSSDSSHKP